MRIFVAPIVAALLVLVGVAPDRLLFTFAGVGIALTALAVAVLRGWAREDPSAANNAGGSKDGRPG
jgi:hypothetical protein